MAEPVNTQACVLFSTVPTGSDHRFGRATLNAPASLNALTLDMVDALAPQLQAWAQDPQIAGVVLDAAGPRAFCAGGDVVSLYRAIRATPAGEIPQENADFFEREYRLDYQIHTYPKPIVCWGHGIVMGGGLGLLAGASHRVATPQTRLAMPEIGIGLYPDVGASWFLPRMPGRVGIFLALTGAPLNAADACFAGLADFILAHDRLPEVVVAIGKAKWLGDKAADADQLSRLLNEHGAGDLPTSPLRSNAGLIDTTVDHDELAGMAVSLRELAGQDDPWLARAGATFAGGSPTSAALSVEMQKHGRDASLAEVFRLELNAAVGCCMHHDFAEGVRALLVDKDKKPRWQPATLKEVGPALIQTHLDSPFKGRHPLADLA